VSYKAAVLRATAVITWGGAIGLTFTSGHERLFRCVLDAAIVTSLAALEYGMVAKAARLYTAMTKASVTRPPYQEPPSGPPSGPMAKLVSLQDARPGRHAHR
jgi:hypothetical protein